MKAQHRHELQTNELAEWLEVKIEQIKPYTQAIIGVLVAAAVLFGVYLYLKSMDRGAAQAASDQLVTAMTSYEPQKDLQATVDNHPGTQQAIVAQLRLGEILLQTGANQLYVNKPEGTSNLGKAADAFLAVESTTPDPLLRAWALFGLGRAHESLGDLERARGDYEGLLKDYPDSALANDARQHLQNLGRQSTKEFYDWFAKQDPRPVAMEREPGIPGQKPAFDLSDPTSPGDIQLPTTLDGTLTPGTPPAEPAPPGVTDSTAPPAPSGEVPPAPSGDVPPSTPPAEQRPDAEKSPASSEPPTPAK